MSLVKSLNSGVSGLNAFQTKMDTIGNNIANVNTTGFKSSRVSFAELISEDIGGAGGGKSAPSNSNQVGLGVGVASIDRNFNQGTLQNTGVNTDLAIEGEGFFLVNNGAQNLMTRNGSFTFNENGDLVDLSGNHVQGYNANAVGNIIAGGATNNVNVDFENALAPQQTSQVTLGGNLSADTSSYKVLQTQGSFTTNSGNIATGSNSLEELSQFSGAAATDSVDIVLTITDTDGADLSTTLNLTGASTVQDIVDGINTQLATGTGAEISLVDGLLVLRDNDMGSSQLNIEIDSATNFNFPSFQTMQEGQTNTETLSATVYDNLGRAHTLLLNLTQTGEGEWEYEASFADGETINGTSTGNIEFDETGQPTNVSDFQISFEPGGGATTTTFNVSFGDANEGTTFTQYAGANTAKVIGQDGYAQGSLIDININAEGVVEGIYDNGQNMALAQLALAKVENEQGLDMLEGGLYQASSAAGEIYISTVENIAGTKISSGALESSNVDLAKEFTEMITTQRAYQSNARVITTSDEMLTEAVNLKR